MLVGILDKKSNKTKSNNSSNRRASKTVLKGKTNDVIIIKSFIFVKVLFN